MSYYENLLSRKRHTRVYLCAQDFLDHAIEYFKWCESNPLQEEQATQYKGGVVRWEVDKVRAFTKKGLCSYLGIPESRLAGYKQRKDPEWGEAVDMIEQIIFTQKFENAAAGLLNASIITRDLGLAEKQEVQATVDQTPEENTVDDRHLAIHVHPDDPDPLDLPRPLYSKAQLEAGMPFVAPDAQ